MALFDASQANGTSLETVDALWAGDSTNIITASGNWVPDGASSYFANYTARYVNGHGAAQKSQAVFRAGGSAGQKRLSLQFDGVNGYEAYASGAQQLQLRRNGVFIDIGATAADFGLTDITVSIEIDGGGNILVKEDGVTRISYTDGTPLTGGYPGFSFFGDGVAANQKVDDWTDGVLSGPTINTQPTSVRVYQGQTANFSISATTSGGSLSYQWKQGVTNVGTNSSSLALVTTLADNGTSITCDVTDSNGTTTSSAAILNVIATGKIGWIRA